MDHVKSRGLWFLLLCSSCKFGGSELGVDRMNLVKFGGFWFLLLRSSRMFGDFESGVDLMNHVKSRGFQFLLSFLSVRICLSRSLRVFGFF